MENKNYYLTKQELEIQESLEKQFIKVNQLANEMNPKVSGGAKFVRTNTHGYQAKRVWSAFLRRHVLNWEGK